MTKEEKLERAYRCLNDFVEETTRSIYLENDLLNRKIYKKAREFCETLEQERLYEFAMEPKLGCMKRNAGFCIIDRIRSDFPELDVLADMSGKVHGKVYDENGNKLACTIRPMEHSIEYPDKATLSDKARVIVETDCASYTYRVVNREDFEKHSKHRPNDKIFYIA